MAQAINASKDRPSDPRNREVVFPADGDPQRGNLETPINDSSLSKWFINNLPAYRRGITIQRRGLEIGMAHGYWLIGPFAKLGPLRDTDVANLAGLLSTLGLIGIATASLALYAHSNPAKPAVTVTTPNPPAGLDTEEGWNEFGSNFLIGGIGGAVVAYILLDYLPVIQKLFSNLF